MRPSYHLWRFALAWTDLLSSLISVLTLGLVWPHFSFALRAHLARSKRTCIFSLH